MKKFLIALVATFAIGSLSFATEGAAPAAATNDTGAPAAAQGAPAAGSEAPKTEEAKPKKGKKKAKKAAAEKKEEGAM